MWCKHKSIQDQAQWKNEYPEYSSHFIKKINKVKKHIFITNNKPLFDYLFDGKNKELQSMPYDKLVEFVRQKEHNCSSKLSKIHENKLTLSYNIVVNWDVSYVSLPTLLQMSLMMILRKRIKINLQQLVLDLIIN
ncbi:hypothetical protein [Wolbachia endosymbiont of Pentidionis agamae]|uniref:hypothetical protein n=1 Tax=Wolbachia endosymbiont of Pentidionis agamae TaxID=3110435 RepID=UPI002FD1527F